MTKVGIIGAGIIAKQHAQAIAALSGNYQLVAVADVAAERLLEFCEMFGVSRRHASAAELIADPEVEFVIVATPPSAHEEAVIPALDAGKYVLCEKPLAHSLTSAARIVEAAKRHPGRLGVGYQFRYGSAFRRLLWLCGNKWIGDLKTAVLERHSYIPHSNYATGGWWGAWNVSGGGVLITQVIHELDMLLLLMGKPVSVNAIMDTRFTTIESEDYVEATIEFEGGRTARCVASVDSGHLGGGLILEGDKGRLDLAGHLWTQDSSRRAEALLALDTSLPDTRPVAGGSRLGRLLGRRGSGPSQPNNHVFLYRDIAENIAKGAPIPVVPDEAMASLELVMAIYASAISGREVSLPLDKKLAAYEGVTQAAYEGRKCVRRAFRNISADDLAMRAFPPEPHKPNAVAALKTVARTVLNGLNIEPATIKALVRKPGPVNGGPRVRRMPWPRRRHFDMREQRAAVRVLTQERKRGGAVAYGGPEEAAYCKEFVEWLGGGYADAVNSGSTAIYIALRALGVEPGSEVIVPPITDPGATMPVPMAMCIPVPSDSAPGSILVTAEQIRAVMSNRTSAIIVAHMAGHTVDMDPILALAAERRIPVIEDCAQAHGSLYKGRLAGTMGTVAAFSTMFGKQHSTGGQGGVVFSRDPLLIAKARQIADRGKPFGIPTYPGNLMATLNFNQEELSMALGRVQLEKLPRAVEGRRAFAAQVAAGLNGTEGVSLVMDPAYGKSSFWFLMLNLDRSIIKCDSTKFATALIEEGIDGVYPGYAVYPTDQPWHKNAAAFGKSGLPWMLHQEKPRKYELPNAHDANRYMVRIEVHESLGPKEARDLVAAIAKLARYFSNARAT